MTVLPDQRTELGGSVLIRVVVDYFLPRLP
jgi:hypothetical protein